MNVQRLILVDPCDRNNMYRQCLLDRQVKEKKSERGDYKSFWRYYQPIPIFFILFSLSFPLCPSNNVSASKFFFMCQPHFTPLHFMCQLYQVKKRANPAQISASIFHSMWDSHWEKKKIQNIFLISCVFFRWPGVRAFRHSQWPRNAWSKRMSRYHPEPTLAGNVVAAGEPWQETEPFDHRRGRDGRGWTARTSHWLRHHAGSGWRIHFHKKTIYLSACHPKSKMSWSIFVTTVFQGETVKEHGEAGTLARSRAARDCPWAPGPPPPPLSSPPPSSSPSSTLSSSSRAA